MFTVRIIPTDARNLGDNKLADVELHFTAAAGALAGLKLTGFTVCDATTWRYVTYPAYKGESAEGVSFTTHFLRLIDEYQSYAGIRDRILDAYAEYERRTTEAL